MGLLKIPDPNFFCFLHRRTILFLVLAHGCIVIAHGVNRFAVGRPARLTPTAADTGREADLETDGLGPRTHVRYFGTGCSPPDGTQQESFCRISLSYVGRRPAPRRFGLVGERLSIADGLHFARRRSPICIQ
jgi:hypothetical protein